MIAEEGLDKPFEFTVRLERDEAEAFFDAWSDVPFVEALRLVYERSCVKIAAAMSEAAKAQGLQR